MSRPPGCTSPTRRRRDAVGARGGDPARRALAARGGAGRARADRARRRCLQLVHHGARGGGARGGRGAPGPHGAAARRPDRRQGRDRRRGNADDRRVEGARGQRGDGRRDGRRASPACGRNRRRQAQHARVRLGRLHDERGVRARPQPVGHRPDLRRVERRQRRRRRRGPRPRRARHRHRRLRPHPRRAVRRHRHPADDRSRAEPRRDPRLLDVRHGRPARTHGGGLCAPPRRDRRARPDRPVHDVVHGRALPRRDRARRRGLEDRGRLVPVRRGAARPACRGRCRRCDRRARAARGDGRAGRRPVPAPRGGRPAARDAARGGGGAPSLAPHAPRRLRRRRSRPPACRPPAARLRPDHRAAGAPRARARGAAALRALRPPRGAGDARRRTPDRRGPDRGRRADAALPACADPLQLTVELPRGADGQRAVRLRRRPSGRARAHRAGGSPRRRCSGRRTRTSR